MNHVQDEVRWKVNEYDNVGTLIKTHSLSTAEKDKLVNGLFLVDGFYVDWRFCTAYKVMKEVMQYA